MSLSGVESERASFPKYWGAIPELCKSEEHEHESLTLLNARVLAEGGLVAISAAVPDGITLPDGYVGVFVLTPQGNLAMNRQYGLGELRACEVDPQRRRELITTKHRQYLIGEAADLETE